MPPRTALLTISMARQAALGKKTFRVVEPDEYDRISTLSASNYMFDWYATDPGEEHAGSFFTVSDKDTSARSTSNESEWWLVSDALVNWLKRQLAREGGLAANRSRRSQRIKSGKNSPKPCRHAALK